MFPIIKFGPRILQSQPLILLIAFWIGTSLTKSSAKKLGLDIKATDNLVYLSLIGGLVGARLVYVFQYWSIFSRDFVAIFALNLNSISPIGGLFVGLLTAYWYARRKAIANRKLLDVLTPSLIILAAGLALADLASGNGYGMPVQLPWSISLWGEWRHPVQIYDLLAVLVILVVLRRLSKPFDGAYFGLFVILYAASRLFFEAFHGDSLNFSGVRVVQFWSLLALIVMLFVLRYWAKNETQLLVSS
ncbi:MAG: prolipoprotein diacylglyceryl transferase family protein [Chloroflexota bacterium]